MPQPYTATTLKPQQILQGRYQLQQQLGRTGAGRQTWLAVDLQSEPQEPVILKLLAFNPQLQWEDVKLFERESLVLQNLNHPRIPRYRDSFAIAEQAEAGLPWFVLVQDYIHGTPLDCLLDRGEQLIASQSCRFAQQVLAILIYLHELSPPVFHRDIKPSNLILGEDGYIYLVDFGAVQDRAKAEGASFTVVGTSGYAAPEQLWGRTVAASDLYALGATLIHLLTGIPPSDFPQSNLRIQFRDRVSLNPGFADWLERLLEPSVERRFNTARQALQGLQRSHIPYATDSIPEKAPRLVMLTLIGFAASGSLVALSGIFFGAFFAIAGSVVAVSSTVLGAFFMERGGFSEET